MSLIQELAMIVVGSLVVVWAFYRRLVRIERSIGMARTIAACIGVLALLGGALLISGCDEPPVAPETAAATVETAVGTVSVVSTCGPIDARRLAGRLEAAAHRACAESPARCASYRVDGWMVYIEPLGVAGRWVSTASFRVACDLEAAAHEPAHVWVSRRDPTCSGRCCQCVWHGPAPGEVRGDCEPWYQIDCQIGRQSTLN